MSSSKGISDKELYETDQGGHDKPLTASEILGVVLVALIAGLTMGPFVMPRLLPFFYPGPCG